MHTLITILTVAESKDIAFRNAKNTLEQELTRPAGPFDYGTGFEKSADDYEYGTSGAGRWGDKPKAAPIDSEAGLQMLGRSLLWQEREVVRSIEKVKEGMRKLVEGEIEPEEFARHRGVFDKTMYEREQEVKTRNDDGEVETETEEREESFSMFGYYLRKLSDYRHVDVRCWKRNGEPMASRKQFDDKIEYMEEDAQDDQQIYVVPFDVHF